MWSEDARQRYAGVLARTALQIASVSVGLASVTLLTPLEPGGIARGLLIATALVAGAAFATAARASSLAERSGAWKGMTLALLVLLAMGVRAYLMMLETIS